MLIDGARFRDIATGDTRGRAIASFVAFVEKKLGFSALYDKRRVPFGRTDLLEPLHIADTLLRQRAISWFGPVEPMPDEPPIQLWSCRLTDAGRNHTGGASVDDDAAALTAALAEGLERYIWWTQRDALTRPLQCSFKEITSRFSAVAPERFTSFSEKQRQTRPEWKLSGDASYLWTEAISLVSGERTYVPAQTVSAAHRPHKASPKEPLIREQITIGLATWPTQAGARLSGALECIERDAYMIMWFNQLTYPRARLSSLRTRSAKLDALVARCERYGLSVHIIPMVTDAPTHAVCAVVEDTSPVGPRFAFGLKAHRSLPHAAGEAILEALRARRFTRRGDASEYDPTKPVQDIGHRGRVYYWWMPEHARHLEFLIAGEEKDFSEEAWEHESPEKHLARVVAWCASRGYECVSAPLGISRSNPMPWHIEMVVIPELQSTHLHERMPHLGGERLRGIPERFGYKAREQPFLDAPHPYC